MRVIRQRDGWLFQSDTAPIVEWGESHGSWEELRSQKDEMVQKRLLSDERVAESQVDNFRSLREQVPEMWK